MSKRDDNEWDLLAGEFVLGTLPEREQKLYDNIYKHDVDFQQRVTRWRERLAPLDSAVVPVVPDIGVWQSIQRELRFTESHPIDQQAVKPMSDDVAINLVSDRASVMADKMEARFNDSFNQSLNHSLDESLDGSHSADISAEFSGDHSARLAPHFDDTTGDHSARMRPRSSDSLQNARNAWRWVAGATTAVALALGAFLWYLTVSPLESRQTLANGFQSIIVDAQEQPLWIVDGAAGASQVRLIALNPPVTNESSVHELWLVKAGNQGVMSLGLLPSRAGHTLQIPAALLANDASGFAVSLESGEGSTADTPSGPILYRGGWRALQSLL